MTAVSPLLPLEDVTLIGMLDPTIRSSQLPMSVTGVEQRSLAQSLVKHSLDNSADPSRYKIRLKTYPLLAKMGGLPKDLDGILNDECSSLFHGLAFRMATYDSDTLFARLEQLLSRACKAEGWEREYSNWSSEKDHWATEWNKFNQFLWLLQCYEYYADRDGKVSFPYSEDNAKPDIRVTYSDGSDLYVECYHYTKWWGTEQLVEGLLYAVDKNLCVERKSNIRYDCEANPFAGPPVEALIKVLAELSEHLKPDQLAKLRKQASVETPVTVCQLGEFNVLLEGSGEYNGRDNAHGDPNDSWPIFRNEILRSKAEENDLANHRPNLLLVNCLGLDFQLSLNNNSEVLDLNSSLDGVWICACGIDDKVESCRRLMTHKSHP